MIHGITTTDVVAIITAVIAMLNSIVVVLTYLKMIVVHLEINSRMTQLLTAAEAAARAGGIAQEKSEQLLRQSAPTA